MPDTEPIRMLCVYRVRKGKDAEFEQLLETHWPALRAEGLSTDEPARVQRGRNKAGDTVFIESFAWKNAGSPDSAHHSARVMAVWEPMGALTDRMDFWMMEPVRMPFER